MYVEQVECVGTERDWPGNQALHSAVPTRDGRIRVKGEGHSLQADLKGQWGS